MRQRRDVEALKRQRPRCSVVYALLAVVMPIVQDEAPLKSHHVRSRSRLRAIAAMELWLSVFLEIVDAHTNDSLVSGRPSFPGQFNFAKLSIDFFDKPRAFPLSPCLETR